MATATKPTLEDVLELASKLTTADQAQLIARIAPVVADTFATETAPISSPATETAPTPPLPLDAELVALAAKFPPGSLAARLAADPNSSLSRVLRILGPDHLPITDEDVERWREEHMREKYGA
jgi:hypothetical protein